MAPVCFTILIVNYGPTTYFTSYKFVLKRNENSLRCFLFAFSKIKDKNIGLKNKNNIIFVDPDFHNFLTFFQAQLNLPHLDTSWNWHTYAMEHVRHCQRGKSSVKKKSCAIKNCLENSKARDQK